MERKQPAKVQKGPAKPANKQQALLKNKPEAFKKNQSPQKSNNIKEVAKNKEEVKAKKNIKGGTKDEFQTSDEYFDQISNINSVFENSSIIKELTEKHGEENVHQIVEQIEGIDLVKFLKAKGHSFFPKRIMNSKKIVKTIENWLQYLYCSTKDCPYNAIITYKGESSDHIYCQVHADPENHTTDQVVFQNELNESEPLLHELEKELLYAQAKILIAEDQNAENKCYEGVMEDLKNKFKDIKNTLNTMNGKVENLSEKPNAKKTTNKDEEFRYRSLSFIKEDCEKCSKINNEILSIISKASRKQKIELFIQALDNECKGIQLDEEFKSCPYLEVPDEIYGKEFNILNIPFQSKVLVNNFEEKIKKKFKSIEIYKKTVQNLISSINSVRHMFQEKLDHYQKLNNERLEKIRIEKETKDKMIKEISFRDSQFYSEKLKIDHEEFKTKFEKSSEICYKLGQFQYNHSDFTPGPIQQSICTTTADDKVIYLGQLKEGTDILEGIGILVASNGGIYEGCWKNRKFNGKGRYIYDDGDYYIGDFKDGNSHGYGIMYYANGNRYEGEWKDDNRHGKCVYYYADGSRYEGENRDGEANGQGTFYWADGKKYTGEFKDDKMNGQGTFYYTDGSWWTGEWKNTLIGIKNGLGTEYAADGTVLRSGNWVDHEYVEPE